MKKTGKYCSKKRMNMKPLAVLLAMVLLVGCAIGGTLAWLLDTSDDVLNTFTPSDIEIGLAETTGTSYKMIPGWTITKDPKVTLKDGSEDAYVFVKIVEANNEISGLEAVAGIANSEGKVLLYTVDASWKPLPGEPGVYYQVVTGLAEEDNTANWTDYVISGNTITVNQNVTKEMMNGPLTASQPTITITAYAAQLWKTNKPATGDGAAAKFTPAEAWALAENNPA